MELLHICIHPLEHFIKNTDDAELILHNAWGEMSNLKLLMSHKYPRQLLHMNSGEKNYFNIVIMIFYYNKATILYKYKYIVLFCNF